MGAPLMQRLEHAASHLHRGGSRFYVRRQYVLIGIACVVAVHTIVYTTTTLFTQLPRAATTDVTAATVSADSAASIVAAATAVRGRRLELALHGAGSRGAAAAATPNATSTRTTRTTAATTASTTATTAAATAAATACDASASPYDTQLDGTLLELFPGLTAFLANNTLLLEDIHPGSVWLVGRTRDQKPTIAWFIDANNPLLPIPPGLLPLFLRAPHSAECSLQQVRAEWEGAHGLVPPLVLPKPEQVERHAGREAALGHPQGHQLRFSMPPLLHPEPEPEEQQQEQLQGEQQQAGSGAEAGEAGGAGGAAAGPVQLMFKEDTMLQAEDRWGGDRLFPMRSMTKALVALLCLVLQDRGRLSVADPVSRFLPAWGTGLYANMTLEHLLVHTSGYPAVYTDVHVLKPGNITLHDAAIRTMQYHRLANKPGAHFVYSELGYQVLAAALEVAAGRPFNEALEELVLRPAGMCHTRVYNFFSDTIPARGPLLPNCVPEEPGGQGAAGHGAEDGAAEESAAQGLSFNPTAALGGVTTVNDLARLLAMLANGGRTTCCPEAPPPPAADEEEGSSGGGGLLSWLQGGGATHRRHHRRHHRSRRAAAEADEAAGGGAAGDSRAAAAAAAARAPPRCVCGGRVVSAAGVREMLKRRPTPGIDKCNLVFGFERNLRLTSNYMAQMGLLAQAAVDAWHRELWGDFGYGYGLWITRNNATGEDQYWLFGAYNTITGLLSLSTNSTLGAQTRLVRPRGMHRFAFTTVSLASVNMVGVMVAGYVAA